MVVVVSRCKGGFSSLGKGIKGIKGGGGGGNLLIFLIGRGGRSRGGCLEK